MPRVKAITTGSIPSFLDVILNFAESDSSSSLAHQDSWPTQLQSKPGGRLVFYGDDTWLKLFPNAFFRADENHQARILYQNARQVLNLVKTAFNSTAFDDRWNSTDCSQISSNALCLQCQWSFAKKSFDSKVVSTEMKLDALFKFLHSAQDIMSVAASSYDIATLQAGIVIAALATFVAIAMCATSTERASSTSSVFLFSVLAYGATMFASSYVEEEQHFWYWMTSGWLAWLGLKV
ncbi:MAG: hypothetical protein Q9187_000463 [Circinaria calcarea]